jgi:hypothetical protein
VNVAPGVDVTYGPVPGANTVAGSATNDASGSCSYYYLCVWEHTAGDQYGWGVSFYTCRFYNLGYYRYPDFAYMGYYEAGKRWNDRISSFINNQTTGTQSDFYNYGVDTWHHVYTSYALEIQLDLRDLNLNDIIDGIIVC